MKREELDKILRDHSLWLSNSQKGKRANLTRANLTGANLTEAYLTEANLRRANLTGADLTRADLTRAYLTGADLIEANLTGANLRRANLNGANLRRANLNGANLRRANLTGADLTDVVGLKKIMGVEPGNFYWKRIGTNFENNDYKFKIGLNTLRPGEKFASDEREMCSYPGFHFSSRSWAKLEYGDRPYEAKIRIPEEAQINEPWSTDGKASADMIEIVQVFLDGKDVTEELRNELEGET